MLYFGIFEKKIEIGTKDEGNRENSRNGKEHWFGTKTNHNSSTRSRLKLRDKHLVKNVRGTTKRMFHGGNCLL